jgi:hypothetical protein
MLIPLVRWFWKRWDSPSKETKEYYEELAIEEQERQVWIEAEQYEAAVKEVEKKWTKSPDAIAPSEVEKQAAIAALVDETTSELNDLEPIHDGPKAPPDEMAADAAKKGASVIESKMGEAENLLREEGELPPEDIGQGAKWQAKKHTGPDDWPDVDW